jgi:hypothetical protein
MLSNIERAEVSESRTAALRPPESTSEMAALGSLGTEECSGDLLHRERKADLVMAFESITCVFMEIFMRGHTSFCSTTGAVSRPVAPQL